MICGRFVLWLPLMLIVPPAAQTAPATRPATSTVPGTHKAAVYDSPMAVCTAYCTLTLEGVPEKLFEACAVTAPELQPAWEAMESQTLARHRLELAVARKFPGGDRELSGGWTIEIAMKSILARLPKAKVEISADGKSATVTYPNEADPNYPKAEPFYCIRDTNGWKVDVVRTEPITAEMLKSVGPFKKEAEAYDGLVADIVGGKVSSLEEVKRRYAAAMEFGRP